MSFERTTPCGVISGTACQWPGIAAYKGIRYATAGRWEFPVPVTHWDGVYDATQYGACCYQPRAFYDEAAAPGKAFYYNEFRKGETYTYSEDCLFLNIWTPADAAPEGQTAGHLLHSRRRLYRRLRPRETLRRPRLAHQRLRGCDHQLPARPHGLCLPARTG